MCIFYQKWETDQILCDIMSGFAVTCVIFQQKKALWGLFLRELTDRGEGDPLVKNIITKFPNMKK